MESGSTTPEEDTSENETLCKIEMKVKIWYFYLNMARNQDTLETHYGSTR